MKNRILILLIFILSTTCFAQKVVTWKDLSKVTFTDKYFPEYDAVFLHPEFSDSVKVLEGKLISITGYFLNIDPERKMHILSKGPMSSCFFCGVGGPETAVELDLDSNLGYKTDDIVTVTGVLKLNANDVKHFNYILSDCKVKLKEQK
ncbi:hypothetical protein [Hyunsoonleella pacifica]|uniref:DUF3299 domain-containing protein n=1 Tax=Hyunsoonleella pacifica TaxID=1080224 RepID=A0A4Q9FS70_9FLAO|nr:hypothetical protein [Hyunsoonleella pacifica]TBN16567.1 hypothetical protein EYD46_07975 [Hyunsoonleella pacifica]GGD18358.1 hypothetical protein GCM10011368_20320 [Hyunsoonleella pacifica]